MKNLIKKVLFSGILALITIFAVLASAPHSASAQLRIPRAVYYGNAYNYNYGNNYYSQPPVYTPSYSLLPPAPVYSYNPTPFYQPIYNQPFYQSYTPAPSYYYASTQYYYSPTPNYRYGYGGRY